MSLCFFKLLEDSSFDRETLSLINLGLLEKWLFGLVIDFKGFVAGIVIFIGPFDFFGLASNLNFSIFK